MKTTAEFLDALKKKHQLTSDYQLSKLLGVKQQNVSSYRTGRSKFDDAMCLKVAELLEVNPAHVLTSIAAERAKEPKVKRAWETAAVATAGAILAAIIMPDQAGAILAALPAAVTQDGLYIMLNAPAIWTMAAALAVFAILSARPQPPRE